MNTKQKILSKIGKRLWFGDDPEKGYYNSIADSGPLVVLNGGRWDRSKQLCNDEVRSPKHFIDLLAKAEPFIKKPKADGAYRRQCYLRIHNGSATATDSASAMHTAHIGLKTKNLWLSKEFVRQLVAIERVVKSKSLVLYTYENEMGHSGNIYRLAGDGYELQFEGDRDAEWLDFHTYFNNARGNGEPTSYASVKEFKVALRDAKKFAPKKQQQAIVEFGQGFITSAFGNDDDGWFEVNDGEVQREKEIWHTFDIPLLERLVRAFGSGGGNFGIVDRGEEHQTVYFVHQGIEYLLQALSPGWVKRQHLDNS